MSKNKTTDKFNLPKPIINEQSGNLQKTLPYNGNAVTEKSLSFSFACFDRTHELFNLGDNSSEGIIPGGWFLDLLDCFKSISNMTITQAQVSPHDLHRIQWEKTNTSPPQNGEQYEYWQFRINKSKGRVIGFKIDNIFYVVWLDPHHNLTNSEGYGKENFYKAERLRG